MCKTNESQVAWGSRVNLKIHENAISKSSSTKKKENKGLLISKTIIIFSQMYGNYQISF